MSHTSCENLSYPLISHIFSTAWQAQPQHSQPLIFPQHMFIYHTLTTTQHMFTDHTTHVTFLATHHMFTHHTSIIMPHIMHSHTNISHITHSHVTPQTVTYNAYFTFHITVIHHSSLAHHIPYTHTFTLAHSQAHSHTHNTFIHLFSFSKATQAWNPTKARAQLCDSYWAL